MDTKECIFEALFKILENKDLKDISITEICRKAGISRMSYYRLYYKKEDILESYLDEIIKRYKIEISKIRKDNKYEEIIKYAFKYFKKYSKFSYILLKSDYSGILQEKLNNYMVEYYLKGNDNKEAKAYICMFSGALYNLYLNWLKNGMKESEEDMSKYFYSMFSIDLNNKLCYK